MNIYLIGYRGSGKTTVGRLLSKTLNREWLDSDHEIENLTGQTIAQIFAVTGEAGFREWEQSVVAGLTTKKDIVVSLGGGAVLEKSNRVAIQKTGLTVWLQASAEELWERISADGESVKNRPALTNQQGVLEVHTILEQRHDVYEECADYICNTSQRTPEQISDEIAKWWRDADIKE